MRPSLSIRWVGLVRYESLVLAPIALGALLSLIWQPSVGAAAFGLLGTLYVVRSLSVGLSISPDGTLRVQGLLRSRTISCSSIYGVRSVKIGPSVGVGLKARMLVLDLNVGDERLEEMSVPGIICRPAQMANIVRSVVSYAAKCEPRSTV